MICFICKKKKYCDVPVYVMLFPDIKWDCWEKLGEIILLEVFDCVWVGGVDTQYLHVNCPLLYVYIYIYVFCICIYIMAIPLFPNKIQCSYALNICR